MSDPLHRLIRSLIDVDGSAPIATYAHNYQQFLASKLSPEREDDAKIWKFVRTYYQTRFEAPTLITLYDYFRSVDDVEVVARLKEYEGVPLYQRSGFTHLLATVQESFQEEDFLVLLKESQEILKKGLTLRDKTRLKGLRDAVPYLLRQASTILSLESNAKTQGNFRDDEEEALNELEATEVDRSVIGKPTGLRDIDTVIKGIRKGQLWIHAAYVGELKSTFALNWAYHLVVNCCSNVFYASLEMPYEDLRRQFISLHSTHPRWKGRAPISYENIKNGLLTPEEKSFFREVWHDFSTNENYGDFHCWCPAEDQTTMSDIRRVAEMINQESDIDLLVIDHGGLVDPEKTGRNQDYTVQLNSVIRGAKKLALQFNRGAKIPVLLLFQINREGKDYADKNQGRYKLRHLSYANEAERSADIVTTSYLSEDLRKEGIAVFDNLKRRDGPMFPPTQIRANFPFYRLYNMDLYHGTDGKGISVDDHRATLDLMDSLLWCSWTTFAVKSEKRPVSSPPGRSGIAPASSGFLTPLRLTTFSPISGYGYGPVPMKQSLSPALFTGTRTPPPSFNLPTARAPRTSGVTSVEKTGMRWSYGKSFKDPTFTRLWLRSRNSVASLLSLSPGKSPLLSQKQTRTASGTSWRWRSA